MKRTLLLFVICLTCFATSGVLLAQLPPGVSVTCENGTTFDNGVEIVINQMRSGFTYTATAVGLNGFDPVLAVLDSASGDGLCSDDESSASRYAANLPSTGSVSGSNLSAQVTFNQNSSQTFADISLVVGGFGNASGEFLLILEGMAVTSGDGPGDIFTVNLTPGMIDSGIPLSLYMLSRGDGQVDPYIYAINDDASPTVDANGDVIGCDDSGNASLCWDTGIDLSDSSVTIGTGTLPGWQYDSMLSFILDNVALSDDPTENYFSFAMSTSPQVNSEGQYLLVFHIGQTDVVTTTGDNNNNPSNGSSSTGGTESNASGSNQAAPTETVSSTAGLSVTCDDGTSFDNGVEVILYDLPVDVTYKATAIGIDGFDPVLAVLESTSGEGLCNDDESDAEAYSADLPSTGEVSPSGLTSQVEFTPSGSGTIDISLVVGGFGNVNGEFLLIVEGVSIDDNETAGDLISLNLTTGMVDSGDPLVVYMVTAAGSGLDPYIVQTNSELEPVTDSAGNTHSCDDAGTSSCGDAPDLSDFSIAIAEGNLSGWQYDTMLTSSLDGLTLDDDRALNYFNFVGSAAPQTSRAETGGYVLIFHVNATEPTGK